MSATVLMYHRVDTVGAEAVEGDYAIPRSLFERHVARLAEVAVPVVALCDLARPAAGPRVVLTFDDGCDTDATVALPLLRERGFAGAFFVNPATVGAPGRLSWDQVAELHAEGMTVGSHGLDHTLLDGLDAAALERQLADSKRRLEDRLGVPVDALSLPGGSGGRPAVRQALDLGYRWVLGSRPAVVHGAASAPVPRFAIRAGDDENALEALVRQRTGPRLKRAVRWTLTRTLRAALGTRGWDRLRARLVSRGGAAS